MNNGITYYRLQSQYPGDVTKDCGLNGYEIDNNFNVLEGRDIESVYVEDGAVKIRLLNGEVLSTDSFTGEFARNLEFSFDAEEGVLTIVNNGKEQKIGGFVTTYSHDATATDSTLVGNGKPSKPLGIAPNYRSGEYRPVKRIIDETKCEKLPHPHNLVPGDRFLLETEVSENGFLYNYEGVRKIACDLQSTHSAWRIPTKDDWDAMLNAIEPNEADRDHSSAACGKYLGRIAGNMLKSSDHWKPAGMPVPGPGMDGDTCIDYSKETGEDTVCSMGKKMMCSPAYCGEYGHCHHHPMPPHHHGHPGGFDKYGFSVVPVGYADDGGMYGYWKERACFWTATNARCGSSAFVKRFEFDHANVFQDMLSAKNLLSLRLVKDYDGENFYERDNILGHDCPAVLMPSTKGGHAIWTSSNVAFADKAYRPVMPNNGHGIMLHRKFYIYEWDGRKWLVNELKEGEEVTVLDAPNKHYCSPYKVIRGELKDLEWRMTEDVFNNVMPKIEHIDRELHHEIHRAHEAEKALSDRIDATNEKLETEVSRIDGEIAADKEDLVNTKQKLDHVEQVLSDFGKETAVAFETLNNALVTSVNNINEAMAGIAAKEEADHQELIAKDNEIIAKYDAAVEELKAKDEELERKIDEKSGEAAESIAKEREERIAADEAEKEAREAKDAEHDEKDAEIEGKLPVQEGTSFDPETGVLTVKSAAGTNDIEVQFSFNFGDI